MVLAIISFTFELLPLEVTALAAISLLVASGILTIEEAVSGFSNKAVIIIGAIFIISRSLVKTGILEVMADYLYHLSGDRKWLSIFIFLLTIAIISGFINNTAAVAIFIPLAINLSNRYHISPTKLLLPLSYAAIFGGTLTLIGTSTNLIVSSIMEDAGYLSFSMFEFTKLGLIFMFVGLAYIMIMIKFIPSRAITTSLTQKYHLGSYLTEFKVSNDSPLIGKTLRGMNLESKYNMQIYKIIRKNSDFRYELGSIEIKSGDIFILHIDVKNMIRFRDEMKLKLLADVKMSQQEISGENHIVVEGLIPMGSSLVGKSLMELNFKKMYSGFVLAIKRQRELLRDKVAHVKLKFSDTLLLMLPRHRVDDLKSSQDIIILDEIDVHFRFERFWWLSLILLPLIMIFSSFGVLPIIEGVVFGAVILLVLRSLSIQDAYQSINWSVIFLIAGLVPVGIAIKKTGADHLLADWILMIGKSFVDGSSDPSVFLAVLYISVVVLSAFISNAAVAVIATPLGFILAEMLSVDPRPFLVAICFGASTSFMTPMGYQTNMMVYAPGKYRFHDFVLFGLPLTLIFWYIAIKLIPVFWPF
tara:strand:- start:316 stop:2073 length:1758 start_codon:yes stop_codon:yes gene_type:complete